MHAADLAVRVRRLARIPGSALADHLCDGPSAWGAHEENTADFLDALRYWLDLAWADRIADPEDPDVRRDRAEAKRAGIKPPTSPLIPPIARRPPKVAEARLREYVEAVTAYQTAQRGDPVEMTSSEFDRARGLKPIRIELPDGG